MYLKIIGACLIILSTSYYGYLLSTEFILRIEQLKMIKKIMFLLRGEIKYSTTPLPEAFATISTRTKEPFSDMLRAISERLSSKDSQTIKDIWYEESEKWLMQTKLDGSEKDRFMSLGDNLGYLDKDMQLSNIELYLEQLEEDINTLQTAVSSKCKLYRSLGVMAGIFITIIIA